MFVFRGYTPNPLRPVKRAAPLKPVKECVNVGVDSVAALRPVKRAAPLKLVFLGRFADLRKDRSPPRKKGGPIEAGDVFAVAVSPGTSPPRKKGGPIEAQNHQKHRQG